MTKYAALCSELASLSGEASAERGISFGCLKGRSRRFRSCDLALGDDDFLQTTFAWPLNLAGRVREQERGQRGPKVYSLHAPEVECIGKGKPHKPYEFGVKVSIATTLKRCKGGQFAIHAQALPGNPYDGHTPAQVIPAIPSSAFIPMPDIAATTRRPITSSRSTHPSRSAVSHHKFNGKCDGAPPSNRSSATPNTSIAWTGTISPTVAAMPTTPSSLPLATTSAS